jgi:DNA-binding phage protein
MRKQPKGIVEQLRQAIRAAGRRGVSQYRLARLSGVSQAQLSKLLSEERIPRLDTAEKIVRALGAQLSIHYLTV